MNNVPQWAVLLIEDVGKVKGTSEQILEQMKKMNGTLYSHDQRIDAIERARAEEEGAAKVKGKSESRRWEVVRSGISAAIGAGITLVVGAMKKGG